MRGALGRFRGEGSLTAYLRVVIHRLLLDYRARKWGKWRPSAQARRLGWVAVEMERLIERDGYSRWEAIRHLRINRGVDRPELELVDLAEQLSTRPSRRFEGEEVLAGLPALVPPSEQPDRCVDGQEAARVLSALGQALSGLEPDDRCLVTEHIVEGLTIAEIARRTGRNQRRLYRQLERALGELRERMQGLGIDGTAARSVLGQAA